MPADTQKCPDCGYEMPGTSRQAPEQETPQPRAVPNIPRREPDSLPERPERTGSSGSKGTVILLIAAVILFLVFYFLMKNQ